jgi:putative sigma-54 modulation protein
MRLALTGRNLTITPALRQVVTRRLGKLDRLLHNSILSAQIALQVQKDRVKADVLVRTRGDHDLSSHGEATTAQASVVDAIAKVEHQATKVKGKWQARKRRTIDKAPAEPVAPEPARSRRAAKIAAEPEPAAAPAVRVIRVRRSSPKPMRLEDALLRVDDAPGSVVVFRDAAIDRVQVLVRRADGHVGLVDPDA